jgi:hypothetical protein
VNGASYINRYRDRHLGPVNYVVPGPGTTGFLLWLPAWPVQEEEFVVG